MPIGGNAALVRFRQRVFCMPYGVCLQRSRSLLPVLDPLDLATLTEIGQSWVDLDEISITRRYRPIGTVELVAVAHSSLAAGGGTCR